MAVVKFVGSVLRRVVEVALGVLLGVLLLISYVRVESRVVDWWYPALTKLSAEIEQDCRDSARALQIGSGRGVCACQIETVALCANPRYERPQAYRSEFEYRRAKTRSSS